MSTKIKTPDGWKDVAGVVNSTINFTLLGAVQGFLIAPTDPHWLLADGSTVDATLHPRLAAVMPVLPDLRECVLVGAGQNTENTIAAHDVYTVGQFKDDQLQDHNHTYTRSYSNSNTLWHTNTTDSVAAGSDSPTDGTGAIKSAVARTGTTTHGKQTGVLFYVWAD